MQLIIILFNITFRPVKQLKEIYYNKYIFIFLLMRREGGAAIY